MFEGWRNLEHCSRRLPQQADASLRQFDEPRAAEITEMNHTPFFTKPSDIVTRIRSNLEGGWTCTLSMDPSGQLAIYYTELTTGKNTWTDPRGTPVEDPPSYASTLDLWHCHFVPKADYSSARYACTHDGHPFFGLPQLRTTEWFWNIASRAGPPLFRRQPTAYSIADLVAVREHGHLEGPTCYDLVKLKDLGLWQEGFWRDRVAASND